MTQVVSVGDRLPDARFQQMGPDGRSEVQVADLTNGRRVVIIGDAAFTARPHVAAGVPKATGDALALAHAIRAGNGDYPACLQQFEDMRLRVGRIMVGRGQYLGAYMQAQLGPEAGRQAAEAARNPDRVMLETAAPFDYGEGRVAAHGN